MLKTLFAAAVAALIAAAVASDATAATAFYEVQHYPADFTKTVNSFADARGSHEYDYANGDVAKVIYGTTPSPSLFISAQEAATNSTRIDIYASFDFNAQITPLNILAYNAIHNLAQATNPPNPVGYLSGYFEVNGGDPTYETATVSSQVYYRTGDNANLNCGEFDLHQTCGGSDFAVNLYGTKGDNSFEYFTSL